MRRQQDRLRQVLGRTPTSPQFDTPEMRAGDPGDADLAAAGAERGGRTARLTMSKEEVVAEHPRRARVPGGRQVLQRALRELPQGARPVGRGQRRAAARGAAGRAPGQRDHRLARSSRARSPTRLAALEGEKREVAEALHRRPSRSLARVEAGRGGAQGLLRRQSGRVQGAGARARRVSSCCRRRSWARRGARARPSSRRPTTNAPAQLRRRGAAAREPHPGEDARRRREKVLAEARKAPQRFAELAKKHSQDTGSAENGGDLGMNARGAHRRQGAGGRDLRAEAGRDRRRRCRPSSASTCCG